MLSKSELIKTIESYKERVEKALKKNMPVLGKTSAEGGTVLREACEYALLNGGKRFRPILVYMIADALGQKKDVSAAAGLGLTIKIGGCEAVKDMLDAVSLGAQRIVAPMIETPYALYKFIKAARTVYKHMLDHVDLLINIETVTAYENIDKFLELPDIKYLKGFVIGRV